MTFNTAWEQSFPVSELLSRLTYDPATGELRRKKRDRLLPGHRASDAGKLATTSTERGYLRCQVANRNVMAHRVAWAMHYGEWPAAFVDHIDGNKTDNRITNLRLATHAQNTRNSVLRKDSTSGHKGVAFRKLRWCARIRIDGKMRHVGSFLTRDEAIAAYRTAVMFVHGDFAPAERRMSSHQHFAADPLS